MTNSNLPASEYEKEIRALYRERNERIFSKNNKDQPRSFRRWLDFFALLFLITAISLAASTATFFWLIAPGDYISSPPRINTILAQPDLADDFLKQIGSSVATVFIYRPLKAGLPLTDQTYLNHEALGQALVLSSDGWLVTTQSVVTDLKKEYAVATADGQIYKTIAVLLDPVVSLAYLKIEARNLIVAPFIKADDLAVNSAVVVPVNESQGISRSWYLRYLASLNYRRPLTSRADLAVSSESLPDRYLLDQSLPMLARGAPVFNLQGKVVGLTAEWGDAVRSVVPLLNMASVIDRVFAEKKAVRPSLGVTYLQTNWLWLDSGPSTPGAVLVTSGRQKAVLAGSPAEKAGLKPDDKILAIDREPINKHSLSLLLQKYRPNNTVELAVERRGQEIKLNVVLGEIIGSSWLATE